MKNTIINQFMKNQKNFDEEEMKKFNALSEHWWNSSSTFTILHRINKIRLNYILKHSNGLFGKKILDLGCGGGILSESMAKEGAIVTGLDISTDSLKIAQLHAIQNNLKINYQNDTIESHAKDHINYYDVITCMEMLEHVPHPISIIRSCSITAKHGGSVFFSTLNRTLQAWLFAIIGAENCLKIIPKGTHDFNKFITPSELLQWIDSTILEEKNIIGLSYIPIVNRCYLTHNISINYILHTQKN